MWKYCTKEQCNDFLLSLDLIKFNWDSNKKIKTLYALSNAPERHYNSFIIDKRNGKKRRIQAPDYLLKSVQVKLLHNVLDAISISKYATAYYKGADILNNALPHLKNKMILKMDITNFFENITFKMVYNFVFKSVHYPPAIKTLLTNLCCYDGYVPQGAPTSSAISNIIMKSFDEHIGNWCNKRNINYTRYCDDLTFSGDFNAASVIKKVSSFLENMGFSVNNEKTKIICRNNRQLATGVVVNEKTQVSKSYRKKIRQEIYYCKKYGVINHLKRLNENYISADKYLESLLGKINFILHINPSDESFKNAKLYIQGLKNKSV